MLLALLIGIAILFLLGAWGIFANPERTTFVIVVLPILTLVFGMVALWRVAPTASGGPYGETRVSLAGVEFNLGRLHHFFVGGDPENDDIVIAPRPNAALRRGTRGRLPSHVLEISLSDGRIYLRAFPERGIHTRAVIRVATEENERYLGATQTSTGARVCSQPCRSETEPKTPLRGAVYFSNHFRFFGRDDQSISVPVGSVGFTSPKGDDFFLTDNSMRSAVFQLPHDIKEVAVDVFEAEPSAGAIGNVPAQPGRLISRRSFHLSVPEGKPGYARIRFDTPQEHLLPFRDPDAGRTVVRVESGVAANSPQAGSDIELPFSLLGRSFDVDLGNVHLEMPASGADPPIIRAPAGRASIAGSSAVIGDDRGVMLRIESLDFSSPKFHWLLVFALLSLLCSVCATYQLRLQDSFAGLLFALLDFLLVLRLLIALEGSFVDGTSGVQLSVPTAVSALTLGPCLVGLMHPLAWRYKVQLASLAGAFVFVASATSLLFDQLLPISIVGMAAICITILAARLRWFRRQSYYVPRFREKVVRAVLRGALALRLKVIYSHLEAKGIRWADRFGGHGKSSGLASWAATLAGYLFGRAAWFAVAGAMVICVMRVVFGLFGWREQIPLFANRLALSFVFVPLTLLILAPLLASAQRGWETVRDARVDSLALAFVIVVGILVPSVSVHDNGFVLFALPAILASAVVYLGSPNSKPGIADSLWAFLFAAALLFVVLGWAFEFSSWLWFGFAVSIPLGVWLCACRPVAVWLTPALGVTLIILLVNIMPIVGKIGGPTVGIDQAIALQDNQLRFFAVLDPDRLAQIGTRGAYALQDSVEHMRAYGDTEVGRGYFTLPPPTVLKPAQLTDYVSAIHIISPFGRLGALAFVLALAAVAAAGTWRGVRRISPVHWLGMLAAYTLFLVSTYMVFANLLAAPFTGRNVYLLAASSMSDLLEGMVLFMIVSATLGNHLVLPRGSR